MKVIRSTKVSLSLANKKKKDQVRLILTEYVKVVNFFISYLWDLEELPKKTEVGKKNFYDLCHYRKLNARWRLSAGRQALGLVKSAKSNKGKKPVYKELSANVNQLIEFTEPSKDSDKYNAWAKITGISGLIGKVKLEIPVKFHAHFNYRYGNWNLKEGFVLTEDFLTVVFEAEIPKKTKGTVIGIDLGINKLITTSDGQVFGEGISKYVDSLSLYKQKSSPDKNPNRNKRTKGYKRRRKTMEQYIDLQVKTLFESNPNLAGVVVENLKNMTKKAKVNKKRYKGRAFTRRLSRWAYSYSINRIKSQCEERGISWRSVNPSYTSQLCFYCDNLDFKSRNGNCFKCTKCGFQTDSDLNAANNILYRHLSGKFSEDFNNKNFTILYSFDKIENRKKAA